MKATLIRAVALVSFVSLSAGVASAHTEQPAPAPKCPQGEVFFPNDGGCTPYDNSANN